MSFLTTTPWVCTPSGANGATIKLVAVGTCTVVAYEPGNWEYLPALPVTQSFRVLASPSLTTTPSASSVTLGTSSVSLKDSAVLSGGFQPTGKITFTLYSGTTLLDTETVSVSGNGTYTTPTGYTLPTTKAVAGTYQSDASYSGTETTPTFGKTTCPARTGHRYRGESFARHDPEPKDGHTRHFFGDPRRQRRPFGWLLPDRQDHLHALRRHYPARHRDGAGEWATAPTLR